MNAVLLQKAWAFTALDIQVEMTSKNETLPEKPVLLSACCSLLTPSHPTPLLNHSQGLVQFNQLTKTSSHLRDSDQSAAHLRMENGKEKGMQLVENWVTKQARNYIALYHALHKVILPCQGSQGIWALLNRLWNLLIQTSCISQLHGQTIIRERFLKQRLKFQFTTEVQQLKFYCGFYLLHLFPVAKLACHLNISTDKHTVVSRSRMSAVIINT